MKRFVFFVIFSFVFSLIFIFVPIRGTFPFPQGQHYIAHACGNINGYSCTNSKEAFESSLKKGIRFIEVDLNLTTDGVLVCTHDWETFRNQTMPRIKGLESSAAMDYGSFKSNKIFKELTPLSIYDIYVFFSKYPDFYLVTDKISDPEVIDKWFGNYKDRVIIECFSFYDYMALREKHYILPMLSDTPNLLVLIKQRIYALLKFRSFSNSIFYVFPISHYRNHKMYHDLLSKFLRYSFALFTVETRAEADSIFLSNRNVRLLYVNDID